jgi:hypothetical protein
MIKKQNYHVGIFSCHKYINMKMLGLVTIGFTTCCFLRIDVRFHFGGVATMDHAI